MPDVVRTRLSGLDLIRNPLLNKGTAFTDAERTAFALHGLLPPHVGTLDEQVARRLKALRAQTSAFQQYSFLRDLQDSNETLFYALLTRNIEEIMPLVYTPTVGEGCQRFSEIWRKPRGLFLSYPNRHRIREILAHPRYDQVRVIVVSDGERILGLGDQGAGGMGIPIGKLALYTACGGIHPESTLPVLLDVGTDNAERRANPLYIGWNHERVRGAAYDDFVETFVEAVRERWPFVLLQWEDFAGSNAAPLLERYRDRLCTFNDDIQGTAAVAAGTLLAAISVTGIPLSAQRIALLGAGSAGGGIASLLTAAMVEAGLSEAEARSRSYAVGLNGLILEDTPDLSGSQRRLALPRAAVAGWKLRDANAIGMLDVIENARPTALIGVTGQPGVFTEEIVRAMAQAAERPIIFPLSNPTSRSEADPADIMRWTEGRALIGTGSPFPPVERNGRLVPVDQCNNSYICPGVGLGVLAVHARRVTDAMFMAAAKALAELSPVHRDREGRLLPPLPSIRAVSVAVATAVAKQACKDGLAEKYDEDTLGARIQASVWEPVYRAYELVTEPAVPSSPLTYP
jgi:malate dehydrogenase (oxaloacetate-decarboxylating)